jgi:hypothetical protein
MIDQVAVDATAGDAAPASYYGTVTATEFATADAGDAGATYALTALFVAAGTFAPPVSHCDSKSPSTVCCFTPTSQMQSPVLVPSGAGTLTLTGSKNQTLATASPSPQGAYSVTNPPTTTLAWSPVDTLHVSASGGTVDAFNGAIVAPTLLQGVDLQSSTTTITRSAGFQVTWNVNTPSSTILSKLTVITPSGTLLCITEDVGGFLVDSSVTTQLTAKDTGTITLARDVVAKTTVGNATIDLVGETSISGQVVIQ